MEQRLSKDNYYLEIAETVLKRSTCLRRKYGAVIVRNDEIIATGYNGSPRGLPNCLDTGICERERLGVPKGERYELCLHGDTMIKLADREPASLRELAESGTQDFQVYAYDISAGNIVKTRASFSRQTGNFSKIMKVSLSDGSFVKCTDDHEFLIEGSYYRRARNLQCGDRLVGLSKEDESLSLEVFVLQTEYIAHDGPVYDLDVPIYRNFGVLLPSGHTVFTHNCVAVHAEQNAIISASRREMLGGTIYIVGIEADSGKYANPAPCLICKRMIINAGIVRCVGSVDGVPTEIPLL